MGIHVGPLSEIFLSHGPAHFREGPISADLEETLGRLLGRCAAAWPELPLTASSFLRHVATRLSGPAGSGEPDPLLVALHAEDLYLACAQGLAAAHAAFESLYLSHVRAWLSGKAPASALSALTEEVQQTLHEQLLVSTTPQPPRIAGYAGRGKLVSWVRIACLRAAAGMQRGAAARRTAPCDPGLLDLIGSDADPEREWMKAHYRQDFEDAFRSALLSLSREQRNLLRLHMVEGMSIDKLAPIYRLSRSTMDRRLRAVRQAILDQTEAATAPTASATPPRRR